MQVDDTLRALILSHLLASPDGKVTILRNNPYRFYIHECVWVHRGIRRIQILDELEQEALAEEAYERCSRIQEARRHLLSLPDYAHLLTP